MEYPVFYYQYFGEYQVVSFPHPISSIAFDMDTSIKTVFCNCIIAKFIEQEYHKNNANSNKQILRMFLNIVVRF